MAYTLDDIGNVPGQAYDYLKRKYISLTKPDEDGDYSSRKASLARQQKMADMLTQMGAQEQAVYTAGGITAPVSPMSALARGLSSFGGAYLSGKAAADEAALKKEQGESRAKSLESFFQNPDTTMTMPGGSYQTDQKGQALPKYVLDDAEAMAAGPATKTVSLPDITSNVAGGQPSYADRVRMAYQFAAGDDEKLAGMAPALLAATKPEIETIGARGNIMRDPLTGEISTIGVPTADSETDRKIQNVGGRSREVIKTPTGITLGADYGPATDGTNVTVKLPPGLNEADKILGATYAEYITGDTAAGKKNMNQLGMAINYMTKAPNMSGGISGALPIEVRSLFPSLKPGANTQQMMQEVVQANLRKVLGPQFTAKEGEGLMKRIYDPQQPTAVNVDRATRLLKSIQEAAQAKDDAMRYFGQNNTISGYKPKYAMVGSLEDIVANAGLSGVDVSGNKPENKPKKPGVNYSNPHLSGG
jgi:hypothetical protein